MHKFKFGDLVKVKLFPKGRRHKGIYAGKINKERSYILINGYVTCHAVYNIDILPAFKGTFTLRKARGGFRYNAQALNGEIITTSEVLKAKQSATEMHDRHYRNYKLVDKTVGK